MAHKNFVHVHCYDGIVAVSNRVLDAERYFAKWNEELGRWESELSTFYWIGSYDYPTPQNILDGETDAFTVIDFQPHAV